MALTNSAVRGGEVAVVPMRLELTQLVRVGGGRIGFLLLGVCRLGVFFYYRLSTAECKAFPQGFFQSPRNPPIQAMGTGTPLHDRGARVILPPRRQPPESQAMPTTKPLPTATLVDWIIHREGRHISDAEVADAVGVTTRTVLRWRSGRIPTVGVYAADRYATTLGVHGSAIWGSEFFEV